MNLSRRKKIWIIIVALLLAILACNGTNHEEKEYIRQTYLENREAFLQLVEEGTAACEFGAFQYRYSDSNLFTDGYASCRFSEVESIEFIMNDFYTPLVYIPSDTPEDVWDTCSRGGKPLLKLEPYWYICQRDWN